jgi:hypothetical protein
MSSVPSKDVIRWRKSSHSSGVETCVELAHGLDAVRDSKNPSGPVLNGSVDVLLFAVKAGLGQR